MLWSTARHKSYFEKKREAARAKRTDDRRLKREEYRARDSAMGRPRTPSKAPAAVPAAAATANPIACGSGTSTAATATATAPNPAAPSVPIAGPLNLANPAAPLVLPLVAPVPSRSSTIAAAPPPRALSPMQEDEPEPLAPAGINPTLTIQDESVLNFTEDDLINFLDVEDDVPLAAGKGKGKKTA
ncbi:hypothetical protein GSI_05615 [Ganoderma sinense ZZ0214-1]|uniref:Uncharacterized protein n=1 Tax=Ganoderma sinense ZZ0214-1 TaxID=1077348 RepID=A0A2G8SF31_9APHY|nr:hypothetical protein GSI_05615 [Ganoderma sinense ZZ0214-1]